MIRRGSWSGGTNAKDPAAFDVRGRCTPERIGKECRVEMRLERASLSWRRVGVDMRFAGDLSPQFGKLSGSATYSCPSGTHV